METKAQNWASITWKIIERVVVRTCQGAFLGLFTGLFAGAICGAIFGVMMTLEPLASLSGFGIGSLYGAVIGLASGAMAFAIQGLIVSVIYPARWHDKWLLSRKFLCLTTLFSSVVGGFSITTLVIIWIKFFDKTAPRAIQEPASMAFFFGSILCYCIGTFIAALMPERLERAQLAWQEWRTNTRPIEQV